MGLHDPFGHLKHKLWPKEGPRVKLPIWLLTIKSRESPWFPCCRLCVKYLWKAFDQGYNFASNLTSVRGLHTKLGLPKSRESQFREFQDSQLESPETKWHLGVGPMAKHREYYKGEGGGFFQVWAMVSFVSSCLLVVRLCTKSAPTTH
jgi:hypothetical protein